MFISGKCRSLCRIFTSFYHTSVTSGIWVTQGAYGYLYIQEVDCVALVNDMSNFQLIVKSILHWFYFTELCDWSRKCTPLSQPIRCKSKTTHELVTRVLLRFRPFTCTLFFYKNIFYKNIEAEICEILRINRRLRF